MFKYLCPIYHYSSRYVYGLESGRQFITPSVFALSGNPSTPGPSRLSNLWSFGGRGSDADGQFRVAFEVHLPFKSLAIHALLSVFLSCSVHLYSFLFFQVPPCNYSVACQSAPCTYDYSRDGFNAGLFTIGADSFGLNRFVGDIHEVFRFLPQDATGSTLMYTTIANLVLPYLQVRKCTGRSFKLYLYYFSHFIVL